MNDNYLDPKDRKKTYYYLIFALAILIPVVIYVIFSFQPAIYKSSGKFAVFYSNSSESTSSGMQTNSDLTKSVAESIKSRSFLDKISTASGVHFDKKTVDTNLDNIVKSSVVTNSNILTIEFNDKSTTNLEKIDKVFLDQLNSSNIITDTNSMVTVKTIDPLYTFPDPIYPEPLKYALAAFFTIIVIGLLLIYSLTP